MTLTVPNAPPRSQFQREASRSWFFTPAAVGAAIVLVLAARWIWVAGLGDYGWDYEIAARILRGEVFFRDFFLLRSPLSYYTLAAWMRILGDHLVVFHLHLWFSYGLALIAGLLVARCRGFAAGPDHRRIAGCRSGVSRF